MSDQAGLKTAKFVGGADEQTVYGGDAPALFIGGEQLDERMPDDHADVVHRSAEKKHRERKPKPSRKPEANRRHSESSHRPKEGAPCFLEWRPVCQEHGLGQKPTEQLGLQYPTSQ